MSARIFTCTPHYHLPTLTHIEAHAAVKEPSVVLSCAALRLPTFRAPAATTR